MQIDRQLVGPAFYLKQYSPLQQLVLTVAFGLLGLSLTVGGARFVRQSLQRGASGARRAGLPRITRLCALGVVQLRSAQHGTRGQSLRVGEPHSCQLLQASGRSPLQASWLLSCCWPRCGCMLGESWPEVQAPTGSRLGRLLHLAIAAALRAGDLGHDLSGAVAACTTPGAAAPGCMRPQFCSPNQCLRPCLEAHQYWGLGRPLGRVLVSDCSVRSFAGLRWPRKCGAGLRVCNLMRGGLVLHMCTLCTLQLSLYPSSSMTQATPPGQSARPAVKPRTSGVEFKRGA